jgi:hypothetical protein
MYTKQGFNPISKQQVQIQRKKLEVRDIIDKPEYILLLQKLVTDSVV